MKLIDQDIAEVEHMLHSKGWDIFSRWLSQKEGEMLETIDDDLGSTVTDVLKREQLLGAKKHCKRLLSDFANFVQSQNDNIN